MLRSLAGVALLLVLATPAGAIGVGTNLLYQIDVSNDPDSLGEVTLSSTTPGELISIVHPLGKGDASGSSDYGLLRARARLDPDFPTDQFTLASAETYFDDALTISGANTGDTATVVVPFRVTGTIRQPFYVSEVTGIASASAEILASSSVEGTSDSRSFGPAGSQPILVNYDASLTAIIRFVVGEPFTVQGSLRTTSEAANLVVSPEVEDFTADFLSAASLQPLQVLGVVNPVVTSESGRIYPIGTISAAPERGTPRGLALSPPGPNPFQGATEALLTLPESRPVRARIIDLAGRQVRVLVSGTLESGIHRIAWDGRDATGQPAGGGVYFLVVESAGVRTTRKLTLIR